MKGIKFCLTYLLTTWNQGRRRLKVVGFSKEEAALNKTNKQQPKQIYVQLLMLLAHSG